VALIKSISGIRGTIGGKPGENLSPLDIVKFTAAYGTWVSEKNGNLPPARPPARAGTDGDDPFGREIRKLKQFYFACPADASRTGFAVSILFKNIAINPFASLKAT